MNSIRELLKKNKTVVLGLVVVLIGFAIYNTFFKPAPVEDSITGESTDIIDTEIGREIINTLNQLKSLNIETELFTDALFQNLNDFSRPLPKQPIGKTNPFTAQDPTVEQILATEEDETIVEEEPIIIEDEPASDPIN